LRGIGGVGPYFAASLCRIKDGEGIELNCNCAVEAERGGKDKMWWEGGDGMGWDGMERGEFLSGGLEERKGSFLPGQDKTSQ
jgi:hypothetical protein